MMTSRPLLVVCAVGWFAKLIHGGLAPRVAQTAEVRPVPASSGIKLRVSVRCPSEDAKRHERARRMSERRPVETLGA